MPYDPNERNRKRRMVSRDLPIKIIIQSYTMSLFSVCKLLALNTRYLHEAYINCKHNGQTMSVNQ
jgi:hypothetical protein